MLSLLLFAGALHVDFSRLRAYRWQVISLAVFSTAASTIIVGLVVWYLLPLLKIHLPLAYCLVFVALISPTDPVAVMGILQTSGAPKDLELVITGESLFNDGVEVVIFVSVLGVATQGVVPSVGADAIVLVREAGGGLVFGAVLGYLTFLLLRSVDNYRVEVLLTLATVLGGYALANHLGISGPLAMVVTGVIVGNRGRAEAMSDTTRRYVDMVWELIDEILNAVLFVLIGREVLSIDFSRPILIAGGIAALVTLTARLITVGLPTASLGKRFRLPRRSWIVLAWGGLRGGISVALALSIPPGPEREVVLALTYCVVVISVMIQGSTIARVVKLALRRSG